MSYQNFGCCVILQNSQGRVLLGKRKHGFKDGYFGLPGGRTEAGEKLSSTSQRELTEETGVRAASIQYLGVVKEKQEEHDFIHFVFVCHEWIGEPQTMELDKCEGWNWYDLDHLPQPTLPGHVAALDLLITKNLENFRDI